MDPGSAFIRIVDAHELGREAWSYFFTGAPMDQEWPKGSLSWP